MKTSTRILRLFNLGSGAHRRRVRDRQAGAARLGGAEGASHGWKTAYWTLAVVLALGSSLVHAQTPTCAAPGCNSVTSDGVGNTAMGTGVLVNLSAGSSNTASGDRALHDNTIGSFNTASGVNALAFNTTGSFNTAVGAVALQLNTTGFSNTAFGAYALYDNTTGSNNTASGVNALLSNTTGHENTASGSSALYGNTTGFANTAFGANALTNNATGYENTASGVNALYDNTYGCDNTASGFYALYSNSWGNHNTATGHNAVFRNTTGNDNTGVGYSALFSNTTGQNNIAIGTNAGYAVTGNNNIDIGSTGSAGESGIIRIGGASQSAAYIAGISSTQLTGSPVYVGANGQLGVLASSERYKTEIASMGSTQKLHALRPVSFHLKNDPKGTVQYGLIAEEVDKVFPELVIRDNAGTIQGVRYDELAPMLLNEVQQQAAEIRDLRKLVVEMQAGLLKLQAKEELVAQR